MSVELTLARGVEVDGVRHREAVVRPVSGAVAELVSGPAQALLPAERLGVLLQRCLLRLGPWEQPTLDQVRLLSVGDRDALALQLRGITFGDRIDGVLTCPTCSERMDVELSVASLLLPPADSKQERGLRPPTGVDLEEAARIAARDPAAAASHLARACVVEVGGRPTDAMTAEEEAEVATALAALEPQSDLLLDVACPSCGATFQLPFDPGDFLLRELTAEADTLHREVHILALHYHWSERDILELPARKRRIYLDLLATAPTTEAVG